MEMVLSSAGETPGGAASPPYGQLVLPATPRRGSGRGAAEKTASRAARFVAGLGPSARRAERGLKTAAEEAVVKAAVRDQYEVHLASFKQWVVREYGQWKGSPSIVAARLLDYIDALMASQRGAGDAEKVAASVRHCLPQVLKPRSEEDRRVRKAVAGFKKKFPPTSRIGLPEGPTAGLANAMIVLGSRDQALETLTRHHGYFRPGETRKMRVSHLAPPVKGNAGMAHWTLTVAPQQELQPSKTQTFDDTVALDSWLGPELGRYAKGRPAESALFTTGPKEAAKLWKAACKAVSLPPKTVAYQLRHGGASEDVLQKKRTHQEVGERGRWSTLASLRRYAKGGRLQRLLRGLPDHVTAYNEQCLRHLAGIVSGSRRPVPLPQRS